MSAAATAAPHVDGRERAGIYIHVPFCSAICPYCDFAVLLGGAERRAEFVTRLLAEIDLYQGYPLRFDTIYLGGGTPSLLTVEQLGAVFERLSRCFALSAQTQIYIEANPEDVTPDRVGAWRSAGVDCVSLGTQSFHDSELAALGRRHDAAAALAAVRTVLGGGFTTVSLDLIYGLPGQDLASWHENLSLAAQLAPQHISCYQLTIHERTLFAIRRQRGQLVELPEDEQARFFTTTHETLAGLGYPAYEVSNFARAPEHRSRHNQKYWDHTPYLGLGPSAHSYDGGRRWWNARQLADWQRDLDAGRRPVAGSEPLGPRELLLETVMLGLRTCRGIDLADLERQHGVNLRALNEPLIRQLQEAGHLHMEGTRLFLSLAGLAIADGIAAAFRID